MPAIPVFTKVKGAESGGGQTRDMLFDLTFVTDGVNSNYTVTGILLTPRMVGGLLSVFSVDPVGHATLSGAATTNLFVLSYDYKTNKIQLFSGAAAGTGLTELAAVDISGVTFRVRAIGV